MLMDEILNSREKQLPAPLVSTSFSFGNRITGNNLTCYQDGMKEITNRLFIEAE